MRKCLITASLSVLVSSSAHAESYYGQALLAMDAVSCSYAAQGLGNADEAEEFLRLGAFVAAHIYSNYSEWRISANTDMPALFSAMTEDLSPPLSEADVSTLTYHTVQTLTDISRSSDEREKAKKKEEGMEAGLLFTLERDLARERWVESDCDSIKDRYLN